MLIGNGLTDGLTQYDYYRPMACGDGGWPAVLDKGECQSMDNALPRCKSLIESCYNSGSVWSCVPASIYCNRAIIGPYQRTGQNPYDIRAKCADGGSLCYKQLTWITKYLNQPHVLEALGAETDGYDSCNFDVNRNFLLAGDWMQPFHRLVPAILEEIPVLIYAVSPHQMPHFLSCPPSSSTNSRTFTGRRRFHLQLARQPCMDRSPRMARPDSLPKGSPRRPRPHCRLQQRVNQGHEDRSGQELGEHDVYEIACGWAYGAAGPAGGERGVFWEVVEWGVDGEVRWWDEGSGEV